MAKTRQKDVDARHKSVGVKGGREFENGGGP